MAKQRRKLTTNELFIVAGNVNRRNREAGRPNEDFETVLRRVEALDRENFKRRAKRGRKR